jgi:hypothetical protein
LRDGKTDEERQRGIEKGREVERGIERGGEMLRD